MNSPDMRRVGFDDVSVQGGSLLEIQTPAAGNFVCNELSNEDTIFREEVQTEMTTPNGRAEIEAMFGNPANPDGTANPAWQSANIQKVAPPDGWRLFYQDTARLVPVSGINMHRLLADTFVAVMDDVWNFAKTQIEVDASADASDDAIRAWLHERRLDQHNGGFNFRPITGGQKLSLHAYGIAIDWDAAHNPRQIPLTGTLPDWWYDIWKAHGWSDGRHFATPDPMHVQFATGA